MQISVDQCHTPGTARLEMGAFLVGRPEGQCGWKVTDPGKLEGAEATDNTGLGYWGWPRAYSTGSGKQGLSKGETSSNLHFSTVATHYSHLRGLSNVPHRVCVWGGGHARPVNSVAAGTKSSTR